LTTKFSAVCFGFGGGLGLKCYDLPPPQEVNMKIGLFLLVAMMAFIGRPKASVAEQVKKPEGTPKVSPEVWKKAQEAGKTVRVIVNLNVPGWTSNKLKTERANNHIEQGNVLIFARNPIGVTSINPPQC
jgi:Na+-transporting methylmalonyl-CoA/oxaloacetate decarboxylase gamma subunit